MPQFWCPFLQKKTLLNEQPCPLKHRIIPYHTHVSQCYKHNNIMFEKSISLTKKKTHSEIRIMNHNLDMYTPGFTHPTVPVSSQSSINFVRGRRSSPILLL